jgi:hypothetical protein
MKRSRSFLLPVPVLLALLAGRPALALPTPTAPKPAFARDVAPVVQRYCLSCHSGAKPKGGLSLERFKDEAAAEKDREVWEKVADTLRAGDMPPAGKPRPAAAEMDGLLGWLDTFLQADCGGPRDPGRVTIRRLNRAEYNNTIRDLVGITFRPADDFPADDVGYGFDNIGDVLSLPPILLEKYLAAAEQIIDCAFQSPEARKKVLPVVPTNEEAARQVLKIFAGRAYRRPLRDGEIDRLLRLVELARKNGEDYEGGVKLAMQAILVSPYFLFRVELDRQFRNREAIERVGDYELASRLSYFLWSSMPDEELFELARTRKLSEPAVLEGQVRRMLKDGRSRALVDNFAAQWLELRNLDAFAPDPDLFPSFDDPLRKAMRKETELFFEHVLRQDRSILDFLDADYTFVNARLARHYGLPGITGDEFRRVSLRGTQRGGLLGQASILAITSNPTRTSPVKRGKWVLDNVLGTPPPPPPPDVPELKEGKELTGTLRQRMEQHRSNALCASCHARMDPLGFGLENFDAIGAWRTHEGKHRIDASGTLPGGQAFNGPAELRTVLKTRQDAFVRCLADKLLTYALGRGTERTDRCAIDDIVRAAAHDDYRFSRLVLEVVRSDPFQKRRGKVR